MPSQTKAVAALLTAATLGAIALVGCRSASAPQGRPQAIDLYVAGVRAYQSGDEGTAISNLVSATEANGNLIMAGALLGDLYKSRGEYDKARDAYERVSRLDPYTFTNHYNLGVTYQLLNQLKEAAQSYLKAIELNPSHVPSNMNLGLAYVALGNNDEAINYLTRATELDPRSAAAWANLGVALDATGRYPDAERAYRTSLDLNTQQPNTLVNLGANLVRQKKTSEALAVLHEAVAQSDTPFAHKQLGDALAQAERFDDALARYNAAIRLNGRYVSAMNAKAETLIAQYKKGLELDEGKRAAALDAWRQSLGLNADQPRVREAVQQWEKGSL